MMNTTQTFVVSLERLIALGSDGILIIRLMRAADDIATANWGLREFSKEQPRIRRHVQKGARRYFVRMQCGHLTEALKLVGELRISTALMGIVARCDEDLKGSFERLVACLPGGPQDDAFKRRVTSIRNRAAFHYDKSLIDRGLRARVLRGSTRSKITRGTEIDLWRFEVADDIEDTIVCRLLWQIPDAANVREEADRISDFGSGLCRDFIDIVGHLAFAFLRESATL